MFELVDHSELSKVSGLSKFSEFAELSKLFELMFVGMKASSWSRSRAPLHFRNQVRCRCDA